MTRTTHTFVVLDLSGAAFDEISRKLKDAGYHHAFSQDDGRDVIDMQGIAVACEPGAKRLGESVAMPTTPDDAADILARFGGVGGDVPTLLAISPTPMQLSAAKVRARLSGVAEDVVERAAELIRGTA